MNHSKNHSPAACPKGSLAARAAAASKAIEASQAAIEPDIETAIEPAIEPDIEGSNIEANIEAKREASLGSEEFCVRIIDLPHSVKGFVTYDEDGFPNIYLNARISLYEQQRAMQHELAHISREDAFSDAEIRSIEG